MREFQWYIVIFSESTNDILSAETKELFCRPETMSQFSHFTREKTSKNKHTFISATLSPASLDDACSIKQEYLEGWQCQLDKDD